MQGNQKYSTVHVRGAQLLTILLVVGLAMTALAGTALAATDPWLFVDDSVHVDLADGSSSFWVPVKLETASKISSVAFGLTYDTTCLTFDEADINNDGVPESVYKTFGGLTTDGFTYSVRHEDYSGDGTKETVVVVVQNHLQMGTGEMGTMDLASTLKVFTEIRFDVKPGCRTTDGTARTVNFSFFTKSGQPRIPSISDEWGNSLTKPPLSDHIIGGAYILHFNTAPTSLLLNGGTAVNFAENQIAGTVVGTFTNNDPDAGDTQTYSLVSCAPDDNIVFKIPVVPGNELQSKGPYDYEDGVVLGGDHSFKVCARVTDSHGAFFNQTFTVNVTDINEPGQVIDLDNTDVYEKQPLGTPVGNLTTLDDPDTGDTHTYALASSPPAPVDCDGTDNASFKIVGAQLQTNEIFDVLTQDIYFICVSSQDTGGNTIFKRFTIDVWNQNDPPVAVDDPEDQVILANTGASYTFNVLTNDTDPEGDPLYVGSVTQPITGGVVSLVGAPAYGVEFTPQGGYSGAVSFTYKAKEDTGWNELESNVATVSFFVVSSDDRGDCNNDSMIDAADFSAIQLEMWDTNDPGHPDNPLLPDWRTIYLGDYAGSPVGCDANSSRNGLLGTEDSVDVADVTCTVRLFFGEECSEIYPANLETPATVRIGSDLQMGAGEVVVPVVLNSAGQNVAAAAFILEYDPALFSIDLTDDNADGIPDAVAFNVPDSIAKAVSVDNAAGQAKIVVFGTSLPLPLIEDGVIANVTLTGKVSVAGESAVNLSRVSLGDDQGRSVPVDEFGGVITFGVRSNLYLPMTRSQ